MLSSLFAVTAATKHDGQTQKFSVQGKIGPSNTTADYINKRVYYVEGTEGMNATSPLNDFVMEGSPITTTDDEQGLASRTAGER